MGNVTVTQAYRASVDEAESCWCDTSRWPEWVDGLARVVAVEGEWPRAGASVTWQSSPAGRGRVRERVDEYEPLRRLILFVDDDSMTAVQTVSFEPVSEGVVVELTLDYTIKRRSPLTPLLDRLFVRRPMTMSLSKTLERFGSVLAESPQAGVG
jgi:Polyketide cyclase / dehydrase and lipid transport